MIKLGTLVAAVSLALLGAGSAQATTITYTSSAAFFAALGATPVFTETYEGLVLNSTIPDGSTVNGITYTTFPAGTDGRIDNLYNKIGAQSLALQRGTDATSFFFAGEGMTVNFASPENAVGIFFNVSPSPVGSLTVSTSAGTAGNGATYDTSTLYFVGLISDSSFLSATFAGDGTISSGYNLDNLSVAAVVPEPASLMLLGSGLAGFAAIRRRRKAKA